MASWLFFLYVVAGATTIAAQSASYSTSFQQVEQRVRELLQLISDMKRTVLPRHCNDLLRAGQRNSGVYNVFHAAAGLLGQNVYCDMDTDGGGWTVIQRRGQFGNNVYYFYRNWTEYASGFGEASKEYWIGNRALHALTSGDERMTLRVVLSNSTTDSVSVDYESIRVENEEALFQIQMGKHLRPEGWDAMGSTNGQKFSTYDRDNDVWPENCAKSFRGGWWYGKCHTANPNGLNLNGVHDSYADGIDWSIRGDWIKVFGDATAYRYSYPAVRIMIRPAK